MHQPDEDYCTYKYAIMLEKLPPPPLNATIHKVFYNSFVTYIT